MKLIKFIILILIVSKFALSAGNAMFGLRWGMSPKKISSIGIKLNKGGINNNIHVYHCDSLPNNFINYKRYTLYFEQDSLLVYIRMESIRISEDIYGKKGKEYFSNLMILLKQKYSLQDSVCYSGRKEYKEPDQFYQCLAADSCGKWIANFNGENEFIKLQLLGISAGTGYITLSAGANPEFGNALKKSNRKK